MTIAVTAGLSLEYGCVKAVVHPVRSWTRSHWVSGMLHADSELRSIDDFYEMKRIAMGYLLI
jgi:hypothetical protein